MQSLLSAALLTALLGVPTRRSTTVLAYHVNPLGEGLLPLDMDTADLRGEIFFDLRSRIMPLECRDGETRGFRADCANPEVVDPNLIVTKLSLTYYGDEGPYGRCNVCNASGVDPFSRLSCTPSEYFCTCGEYSNPYGCNAQVAVGLENISGAFSALVPHCSWEQWMDAPWTCRQPSVWTPRNSRHVCVCCERAPL